VAQQLLDAGQVDAAFQQMSGKTVAQGMNALTFVKVGAALGLDKHLFHGALAQGLSWRAALKQIGPLGSGGKVPQVHGLDHPVTKFSHKSLLVAKKVDE